MTRNGEHGFAQILLVVGLLIGLVVAVFVVTRSTNILPQASEDNSLKSYIVVFKDEVTNPESVASEIALSHSIVLGETFQKAINGFSMKASLARLEQIKADGRVKFVSEDKELKIAAPKPKPTTAPPASEIPTGVSRIGAVGANKGTGVGVAVLDTGIQLRHADLKSNIVANKSCVSGVRTGDDDNGHGTHVAGVIAALANGTGVRGVAPEAKLVSVKVLDSTGTGLWSSVICGLDWVIANASTYNIKVVNLSLVGGGSSDNSCGNVNSDALHLAICRVRDAGITVVAAAGNENANTSGMVPAGYDDAVVTVSALVDSDGQAGGVGATTVNGLDDTFANFSNYGTEVDLGAPGVNINSTWIGGAYNVLSGTSEAAPHVAGVAALYLNSNPSANFSEVKNALLSAAEPVNLGHSDPSGYHPEPVVKASSF